MLVCRFPEARVHALDSTQDFLLLLRQVASHKAKKVLVWGVVWCLWVFVGACVGCCVVLCGVVWCCVVLCGVVWCCVVLCDACGVLCGVVWCCVVLWGVVWCCVVLCGVV